MRNTIVGYVPPRSYPAAPPSRAGCPCAAVLVVVVAAQMAFSVWRGVVGYSSATRVAIPVADRFLGALQAHEYAAAEALLTPAAQQQATASDLGDIGGLEEKHGGTLLSHGAPQTYVAYNNGEMSVTLTYTVAYRKKSRQLRIVLQRMSAGDYKVYRFDFNQ